MENVNAAPFSLYFSNHGYGPEDKFPSFDEALARVKKAGMDAQILENGTVVAVWSFFGGTRRIGRR